MPQAVYVVFGWLFTTAVSFAAGRLVLARLRLPLYRDESRVFAFLLGSAVLSGVTFALAAAQLLYKGVMLAAGVAILAAAWRWARTITSDAPAWPMRQFSLAWMVLAAVLAIPFVALTLSNAMAPEMSPDGSAYHLWLVGRYYRERGFPAITTSIYANLSQGLEMLFLYAWPFAKHSGGALVHWNFLAALAWLLVCFGRRFAMPNAGLGAALVVCLAPVVLVDASSAYNDVALAAILFATYYLVQVWDRERSRGLLAAIGALAGFGYAIKYTAFLAAVYAAGFILWRLWRTPRECLRAWVLVGAAAALWVAPWMIKNAIIVGNPLSPFANRLFRNPYVHVSFEERYVEGLRNYGNLPTKWDIPLEVTIRGQRLNGFFGPLFLLSPLALLALRTSHGRRLLLAALLFAIPYAANIGTRFLIPAAPFVSLAMAMVLARVPPLLAVFAIVHAVTAWPDITERYADRYAWSLNRTVGRAALRLIPEQEFLGSDWQLYHVAQMIEQLVPKGKRVLSWEAPAMSYTTRDVIIAYQSAYGEKLEGLLWTPLIPELPPTLDVRFRLPGNPMRRVRLRQTADHSTDQFLVSELRLYHDGRELPREADWRLRAWPNPWDVRDAFDGSPVTRWMSWERLSPRMFLEVEFGGAPRPIDVCRVYLPNAQADTRMAVEWEDGRGNRGAVTDMDRDEVAPPLEMRREAMSLVKEAGVDYLLVFEEGFGWEDFHTNRDRWGIDFLNERYGFHLYAIR